MKKQFLTTLVLCAVTQLAWGAVMNVDDATIQKPISSLALDEIITLAENDNLQLDKAGQYLDQIKAKEAEDDALSAYRTVGNALSQAGVLDFAAKAYVNALRIGDVELRATLNSLGVKDFTEENITAQLLKNRQEKAARIAAKAKGPALHGGSSTKEYLVS